MNFNINVNLKAIDLNDIDLNSKLSKLIALAEATGGTVNVTEPASPSTVEVMPIEKMSREALIAAIKEFGDTVPPKTRTTTLIKMLTKLTASQEEAKKTEEAPKDEGLTEGSGDNSDDDDGLFSDDDDLFSDDDEAEDVEEVDPRKATEVLKKWLVGKDAPGRRKKIMKELKKMKAKNITALSPQQCATLIKAVAPKLLTEI